MCDLLIIVRVPDRGGNRDFPRSLHPREFLSGVVKSVAMRGIERLESPASPRRGANDAPWRGACCSLRPERHLLKDSRGPTDRGCPFLREHSTGITLSLSYDVNSMHMKSPTVVQLEERTARLTVLIDPRKKSVFERLCAQEDLTPSQVVRRMIRSYIEGRIGRPWNPNEQDPTTSGTSCAGASRRRTSRT